MPSSPEEILAVERCTARALPHDGPSVDGWSVATLGRAPRRLGSVSCFGIVPRELAGAVSRAEQAMSRCGITPTFRLTPLDDTVDAALAGRYAAEAGALVMIGSPGRRRTSFEIPTHDRIDPAWWEDLGSITGMDPHRLDTLVESHRRLTMPAVVAWLPGIAVGRMVVDGPSAGLFDVAIHPSERGKGLGSALVDTMLHRAADAGVTMIYLQVHHTNRLAIELYRRRSLQTLYRYTYRVLDQRMA